MDERYGPFGPLLAGRWSDLAPFGVFQIHPLDGAERLTARLGGTMREGGHRSPPPPHRGQPGALDALTQREEEAGPWND